MDRYDGRNLVRYLGSWQSAVGFVLFAFGIAGLFVTAMVAILSRPQDIGGIERGSVAWCIIAVPLGLSLRRAGGGIWLGAVGTLWLVPLFLKVLGMDFSGIVRATPHL